MKEQKIKLHGVYMVLDSSTERGTLLTRLEEALQAGTGIVQVWNNWRPGSKPEEKKELIGEILSVALPFDIPVLINEEWQWLIQTNLHGVHFDNIPDNFNEIREQVGPDCLIGLTCGNDMAKVRWAEQNSLSYVSFCSMFPSRSVDSCEIVSPGSVRKAREITQMPVFLSGGILPENLDSFGELDFQGVAVISGIMDSGSVTKSVLAYHEALEKIKK